MLSGNAYSNSVFDYLEYGMTKKQVHKIVNSTRHQKLEEFRDWVGGRTVALCFKGDKNINQYFSNFNTEITTHYNPKGNPNVWYVFENVTKPSETKFSGCKRGDGTLKAVAFSRQEAIDLANASFVVNYSNFKKITKREYKEKEKIITTSSSSASSQTSTKDKIIQAKQICTDLGFQPKTEKHADCALKMMSIQFETTNKVASSSGGTTQEVIVTHRNDYDIWDALVDYSRSIDPKNKSTTSSSSNRGTNCVIGRTNPTFGTTTMNCN